MLVQRCSGSHFTAVKVCDGQTDEAGGCDDKSDEVCPQQSAWPLPGWGGGTRKYSIPAGYLQCGAGDPTASVHLHPALWCDGVAQCPGGEDEQDELRQSQTMFSYLKPFKSIAAVFY